MAKRLGEIFVSLGYCTGRTMQKMLRKQAKMKEAKGYALRIGHICLDEGLVTEHQLATALATQYDLQNIELIGIEMHVGLLKSVPEPVQEKYSFVTLKKDLAGVHIATDEILPKGVMEGLARTFTAPIKLLIAPTTQLQKVQRWCRQHRRRIMSGQLDKVTLPAEYFVAEANDPESTIRPGAVAVSVNSLKPVSSPGGGGSPETSIAGRAARRARREANPSLKGNEPAAMAAAAKMAAPAGVSAARLRAERNPEDTADIREPGTGPGLPELNPSMQGPAAAAVDELPDVEENTSPGEEKTHDEFSALDDEEPEEDDGGDLVADLAADLAMDSSSPEDEAAKLAGGEWNDNAPDAEDEGWPAVAELFEQPAGQTAEEPPPWFVEVDSTRIDNLAPLSRVLVARPTTLESLLRELRDSACETLTLSPRGEGADVITTDEDGSRVSGAIGPGEFDEIMGQCLKLLDAPSGQLPVPARSTLQWPVDGTPMSFRLTAIPSAPPTFAFTAADRDAWTARRQVAESPLVDALTRRVKTRRGMVLVTGDTPAAVTGSLCGVLSALRRAKLRLAFFSGGDHHVREVTTIPAPADRVAGLIEPANLLAVSTTGVDLLAFDVPLTPDQLKAMAPLAASDTALLVGMKERSALGAVGALMRTKLSPAVLSSLLEMSIAVYRADRLCASCRREVVLKDEQIPAPLKAAKLAETTVFEAPGCAVCEKTGVRGSVFLYEVLTWDRTKATADVLALDPKAMFKKILELQLLVPVGGEARKALTAGSISFKGYCKLLGLGG